MTEEEESKRLHISGLNSTQCSVQDLKSRIDSFQLKVIDVHNWPPGKDAVGNVQNWCFLTLQGEGSKIKRAIQVLNGTVWKGSKLRLGEAKDQEWMNRGETSQAREVKVEEENVKRLKKKRSKRIESERIEKPVEPEEVDEGLWGWHKTPAGHLIKPVHLRPDHPLAKPAARIKDSSEGKNRKRRAATSLKPPSRAKRVTLDPSRYGSVHLTGSMLDDESDAEFQKGMWECLEDDSGDVIWILKDAAGKAVKSERVQVSKPIEIQPDIDEDDDNDSIIRSLGDALDNASSATSSEMESSDKGETSTLHEARKSAKGVHYDPGEESDFSEGYQEVHNDDSSIPRNIWQDEKQGQVKLLEEMFGSLPLEKIQPISKDAPGAKGKGKGKGKGKDSDDEELEQKMESAKGAAAVTRAERRAALLKPLTTSSASQSFKPLVRFDPGMEVISTVAEKMVESTPIIVEGTKAPEEEETSLEVPQVQISSLKDMFRPKEDTAGFSLLADLDLDLDEEEESEEEDEEATRYAPPIVNRQIQSNFNLARNPASIPTPSTEKAPLFFPTFDGNDKSWLGILQKDPTVKPFRRDQTDEEIQAIWSERKRTLTQEYKIRHREALKKKKRKYTGSRMAGTSHY